MQTLTQSTLTQEAGAEQEAAVPYYPHWWDRLSHTPFPCFNSDGLITCGNHHTPNLRIVGATSVHGDADINETSMMNVYITRTYSVLSLPKFACWGFVDCILARSKATEKGNGTRKQPCCCHYTTFSLLYPTKSISEANTNEITLYGVSWKC